MDKHAALSSGQENNGLIKITRYLSFKLISREGDSQMTVMNIKWNRIAMVTNLYLVELETATGYDND
jgi:hypothetical protein